MTATGLTLPELRAIDLFDDLSDEQLGEWAAVAGVRDAAAGELFVEQGEQTLGLLLVLEGTLVALRIGPDGAEPVDRHVGPTWMGAIAVLTGGPMPVRVQALTACRLAVVLPQDFRRLVHRHLAVHDRVMAQITPVYRRFMEIDANSERLASLGTMAAGLAHELNNPVAAARRSAEHMIEMVDTVNATLARFVEAGIERTEAEQLVALRDEAAKGAAEATALDALDAADAEDALLARLEELGVPEAWRIAEPLAAAGVDEAWLDRVAGLAGPATNAALCWVAATLSAGRIAAELEEATGRMSSLVGAIKSYAYLDRGAHVEVDLHEGLETTLTVLGHKLKHTSIRVERDYDRGLPKLIVRGSQLNQVWTNLLDNAIDALGDSGTIAIATRRDGDCAVVEIADDGAGIRPGLRDQIFDPFFTTKDVGKGTGLGLSTARRIVVGHNGSLTLDATPGRTAFTVRLPLGEH